MQDRAKSDESRAWWELIRAIYPNSGYSYSANIDEIIKNLRTSTTIEKVRKFHSEFYRPENLTIVIMGQVMIDDVAKVLEPIEKRILSKETTRVPFQRPWQKPFEPLIESINKRVVFSSDSEDCGTVNVGWRGPHCAREYLTLKACTMLLEYLSKTAASPLQRELVKILDPLARTVSYNFVENSESLICLSFHAVPTAKLDLVYDQVQRVLSEIADGKEKIDMQRMQNIIKRCIAGYLQDMESSPHEKIAYPAIANALHGNTNEDVSLTYVY